MLIGVLIDANMRVCLASPIDANQPINLMCELQFNDIAITNYQTIIAKCAF